MSDEVVKINVRDAVKAKLPKYAKYIPGFVYRWLERVICQDELNRILTENRGKTGSQFAEGALNTLGISLRVEGRENLPEDRCTFVSNHPLGGLDGIALIAMLGKHYGDENVRCLVNDVLMAVRPLDNVFLPVNKYGAQSRASMRRIEETYAGNKQIMTFPAGLCSRKGNDGKVRDLQWQKSFITKSVNSRRDVVPIFFSGLNSKFFYRFARIRKKLGIRFNIELIFLPSEMVKNRGQQFVIHIGKPIPYTTFDNSRSSREWTDFVKETVYSLATDTKNK